MISSVDAYFTYQLITTTLSYNSTRDMADIVNKQGVMVDEIAITTEQAHDRAKAGLEQVQKAAQSQSSCLIS
jgi:hypothetical protein